MTSDRRRYDVIMTSCACWDIHRTEGGVNTDLYIVNGIDGCVDSINMGITNGVRDCAVARDGDDSKQNGESYLENETY